MTKQEIQDRFYVQPIYQDDSADLFENLENHQARFDAFLKNPNHPCVLLEHFEPVFQSTYKKCLEYILAEYPNSRFIKNMLKKLN
jgi:hypothetical protein